jgi:hypothetical protein
MTTPTPANETHQPVQGIPCNASGCDQNGGVAVLGKTGDLIPLCPIHRPRVPEELLGAWLFEEANVIPDVSVGIVKTHVQKAVLEHIQRCLILLFPLASTGTHEHIPWEDRTEEQRVAQEAYSALHHVEKDWLKRLGRPGDGDV